MAKDSLMEAIKTEYSTALRQKEERDNLCASAFVTHLQVQLNNPNSGLRKTMREKMNQGQESFNFYPPYSTSWNKIWSCVDIRTEEIINRQLKSFDQQHKINIYCDRIEKILIIDWSKVNKE